MKMPKKPPKMVVNKSDKTKTAQEKKAKTFAPKPMTPVSKK